MPSKSPKKDEPPDPISVAIGRRLRARRIELGMSGDSVGAHFDYSDDNRRKTVSHWETGRSLPNARVFRGVCDLYKISADDLLWGPDDPPQRAQFSADLRARLALAPESKWAQLEQTLASALDLLDVPHPAPKAATTAGDVLLAEVEQTAAKRNPSDTPSTPRRARGPGRKTGPDEAVTPAKSPHRTVR